MPIDTSAPYDKRYTFNKLSKSPNI